MSGFKRLGVLGAGAWGTALAELGARGGADVSLYARDPALADEINETRVNSRYLPDAHLNRRVTATADLAELSRSEAILVVCPAQAVSAMVGALAVSLPSDVPLVLCAKGIERRTGRLMTDVVATVAPQNPVAVLSGPTFAHEVASGLPAAVTLASADPVLGRRLIDALGQATFRPYYSDDMVGAEVGGAVKNVLAIACGVVAGRGLGENARAALITRGFREMTRFGVAKGGRLETMAGLSGLGDLILTCSSGSSRNTSVGIAIGKGKPVADVLGPRTTVAEGVETAPVLLEEATRLGIDVPITSAVNAILFDGRNVGEVIGELLTRPYREERA